MRSRRESVTTIFSMVLCAMKGKSCRLASSTLLSLAFTWVSVLLPLGHTSKVPTCATAGTTVTIEVQPGEATSFKCSPELPVLDPPVESGRVYTTRSCSTAVPLTSQVSGSLEMTHEADGGYTLRATRLPVYGTRVLYFRCILPSAPAEACKVMVIVSQGRTADPRRGSLQADELPTCSLSGTTISVQLSPRTRKASFRCGPDFPFLDPPLREQSIYLSRSCAKRVPLELEGMKSLSLVDGSQNLFVLTADTLPAKGPKTLFYRCTDSAKVGACKVMLQVPRSLPDPESAPALPEDFAICNRSGTTLTLEMMPRDGVVQFGCGGGMFLLDPPLLSGAVYATRSCLSAVPLRTQVDGYIAMSPSGDNAYRVYVKDLPRDGPKTLFYQCQSPGKGHACKVSIRVPAQSSALAPLKLSPDIPSCTENGATTTVLLSAETKTAQFGCSPTLRQLDPPLGSMMAYASRSCTTAVPLGDLVSGAISGTSGGHNVYTLRLDGLPSREPKEIYFLCRATEGGEACKVLIKVPRRPLSARTAAPSKVHVCHAGRDASIRIVASPYAAYHMRCAVGLTHSPSDESQVYDDSDGACSSQVNLDTLVRGAHLTRAPPPGRGPGTTYVFSTEELPTEPKHLCFRCAPNSNLRTADCRILVTVPGRRNAEARIATTSSPQSSVFRSAAHSFEQFFWGPAVAVLLARGP
ncbi:sag-related sequence srs32 [Cystoisospora suis]|uniref:Sag-related sequence srs32 n=1 Tax=Cystoisospora suis TaxID=483139 RepID=A0A2C6KJC6_9APIC|nr:sag-related sequence srs32 [Cystoisospora suis]